LTDRQANDSIMQNVTFGMILSFAFLSVRLSAVRVSVNCVTLAKRYILQQKVSKQSNNEYEMPS